MPQDAFTLRLIAKELDETLAGGRINKILQPDKDEISLIIYTEKRTLKLTINANASDCGAYFTEDDRENPLVAPNFCMLLRKRLQGARLVGVGLEGFERILVLRAVCESDFSSCERELRAEIMGKYSNVILTEHGTVLGALKTTMLDENCRRAILPGVKYTLPAPQDKVNPLDKAALAALLSGPRENPADFLFKNVSGLAPSTARQIVKAYRGGDFAEHVYGYIFSDEISPCVTLKGGNVAEFFARYEEGGIRFPTLSEAQSYYYEKRRGVRRTEGARRKLLSCTENAVKKHEKRLAQILERREECADAELNRVKGELITANLYRLGSGMRACKLENYYEENAPLEISLDPRLSPSQNAQAYYKKYRKQKRALEMLGPQEEQTRAELDYLLGLVAQIVSASDALDLACLEEELIAAGILAGNPAPKRKKVQETPYRSYEFETFRIFAGRNNLQNDRLMRESSPDDIWLHAQRYHSCHVVIKTEGREVPERVLQFAADLCARHSDGKGDKIPVDYCPVKRVKKPSGAKAGFVVYSSFRTLLGDPAAPLPAD